jgi:hypothetical protein
VYNYFPVKADMFFDEASDILAELLAAVRYRAAGQSALAAVGTFIAGRVEWPPDSGLHSPRRTSASSSPTALPCRRISG